MTCYIIISRDPTNDEIYVSPFPSKSLNAACDCVYRSREAYADADVIRHYAAESIDEIMYSLVSRETGEIYDQFTIKRVEI